MSRHIFIDYVGYVDYVGFRGSVQLQGSLINGIKSRLTEVEERLSDLDARGSEEHDNLANERDLNRFILSGRYKSFSWLFAFRDCLIL